MARRSVMNSTPGGREEMPFTTLDENKEGEEENEEDEGKDEK